MPKKAKTRKAAKKTVTPARKAAKKRPRTAVHRAPKRAVAARTRPVKKAKALKAKPAHRAGKKPLAKKPAAKKTVAKKTVAKKALAKGAVKRSAARAKPIQRRDHAGHIDPRYAAELRDKSTPRDEGPSGFLERPRSKDDLVEELGEEFVQGATSGEYKAEDALNEDVTEEVGGPFVETSGGTEFAGGTDASNPESATREPFPRT